MNDYVVTVDDGRFVLSVRRLVRVAVFEEDADARLAAEFFAAREATVEDAEVAPTAAERVTETTKAKVANAVPAQIAEAEEAPPAAPKDVTVTPEVKGSSVAVSALSEGAEGWTEDRLEAAFKRIDAGERLMDVARDMGGDWRSLRGRWGAHKRAQTETVPDQQPCSICERLFTPSNSNPDQCARCARG